MDLVFSSIGIVSSVGRDAVATCASIRAGIARPSPVPDARMLDRDTNEVVPIKGHPITSITDGFSATARWLRMAAMAFADLIRFGKLPPVQDEAFWRPTGFIFVTPVLDDERFEYDARCQPSSIEDAYLAPLLKRVGLSPDRSRRRILSEGRVGTFRVVAESASLMDAFRAKRIVVLAVDSFLDGMSLMWLGEQERLKTDDNPVGLAPGEAAVALLLEERQQAERRQAPVLAGVVACALGREAQSYYTGQPNTGRGLAEAMTACLNDAGLRRPYQGDVYMDLNGETWRAKEYGGALARMPHALLGDIQSHFCAVSVGDTGAGSGALNLALAARALDRGYARGDVALAACSSEEGQVGVCALKKSR